MGYKLKSFGCGACGHEWDDLFWNEEEPTNCPKCNDTKVKPIITTTGLATYSLMDKDAQFASLKKRSYEHTAKLKKRGEHLRPKKQTTITPKLK